MPQPERNEQSSHTIEHQTPHKGMAIRIDGLQIACQRHQGTIAKDNSQSVEGVADANEPRLLMLVEFQHIIAIGGNIVGGTGKGHQEEAEHGALKPEVGVQGEGDACQRRAQQQLHGEYPPAFGLTQVDKRTPEGFDNPGQAQPTGIKAYLCVCQSHLHIKHYGDGCHNDIGQTLCHVERGYPHPRGFLLLHIVLIDLFNFCTSIII